MKRIAFITAPNPRYANTGMVTVDLAAAAFASRLGDDVEANWYTPNRPDRKRLRRYARTTPLPFSHSELPETLDEVYGHDAIVYWGDFLHARHYLRGDAFGRLRRRRRDLQDDEVLDSLHRCLLLRGAPDEVVAKTILFGSTILFNRQSDYDDPEYGPDFLRLVRGCRAVWMREAISAARLSQQRGDGESHFGVDAALLLEPGDLQPLPTTEWSQEIRGDGSAVGVFAGARTPVPAGFTGFCRRLAGAFGAKAEWLPWFAIRRGPGVLRLPSRGRRYTVGDLLAALPRYRFVITDTYHLALNCWRSGTPAVCIGAPQPGVDRGSLSDLKKHVFYLGYDATDFYLSTPLRDVSATVDRLAGLLRGGTADAIIERIRVHAARVEACLQPVLRATLGASEPAAWPPTAP